MQEHAPQAEVAHARVELALAVFFVACHRMAGKGRVNTNLVRAAGVNLDIHEGREITIMLART